MKMNMKKIFSWGMMLAAAFTLTNCAKEIDAPVQEPESFGYPFEIVASTVNTKTVNDGMSTKWAAGDQLNVFHVLSDETNYENDGVFTVSDIETGVFTGKIAKELDVEEEYDWFVMYPYSSYIETPGAKTDGYTYIGYSSGLNQSGYDSMASLKGSVCPLYGVLKYGGVNPVIEMQHLSSIVAINVTNKTDEPLTVTTASFTATEDIVGSYFIDITKTPVEYTAKTATATATVNVSNGTALAKGESAILYAAIKPFTAAAGQKLTLSVNGYSKEITLTNDVTFTAGKIKTLNFGYDKIEEPEDESVETFTWDLTKASYSAASASEVTWTSDFADMVLAKGNSQTNADNYLGGANAHTRVYKDQVLTLKAVDAVIIKKVEFNVVSGYMDEFEGATWSNATTSVSGLVMTVMPTDLLQPMSVTIGSATRFTSIKVYYTIDEDYVPPTVESIEITTEPTKTEFTQGSAFEFDGVVMATYDDGSKKDVTKSCTFSGYDMNTPSEQTVTITFEGKTTQYNITITELTETGPIVITLGLSKNIFNFSTSKANGASNETSKTYDGYTYKFKATESCYYYNSKALLIGKKDSYITFPAIPNYKLTSVKASNCTGASAKASVVICSTSNTTAVSGGTASTISAGGSKTWTLSSTSAGTSYRMYITNAYAVQLTELVLTYTPVN